MVNQFKFGHFKLVKMTKKNWLFGCIWDNQFLLVILNKNVIWLETLENVNLWCLLFFSFLNSSVKRYFHNFQYSYIMQAGRIKILICGMFWAVYYHAGLKLV